MDTTGEMGTVIELPLQKPQITGPDAELLAVPKLLHLFSADEWVDVFEAAHERGIKATELIREAVLADLHR